MRGGMESIEPFLVINRPRFGSTMLMARHFCHRFAPRLWNAIRNGWTPIMGCTSQTPTTRTWTVPFGMVIFLVIEYELNPVPLCIPGQRATSDVTALWLFYIIFHLFFFLFHNLCDMLVHLLFYAYSSPWSKFVQFRILTHSIVFPLGRNNWRTGKHPNMRS